MAVTLELNSAAIAADLNLNAGAGAGIRMSTWNQAVATPVYGGQPGPVKETMDLMVEGASHNALAASMQALDAYRVQADAYMRDRTTEDPVWLECKMDDETGARRALVISIDEGYRLPLYAEHTGPPQDTTEIRLTVWRMPYWEDTAITASTAANPAAAASVVYDYTAGGGDIMGDVPARIADSYNTKAAAGASGNIERFWIGTRSANKHGTLANFINIWECEDGTNGTDAADAVDATASAGNMVAVTPGTATWAERMSIELSDVTANYSDNLGLYLWLLRVATTLNSVWEIQLRFGYWSMGASSYMRGPIVEVNGIGLGGYYNIITAGIASIPIRNTHTLDFGFLDESAEETWTIQIWARRTVGAGNLYLDCLCPCPIDESWMTITGTNLSHIDATHYDYVAFGQSPEDQLQAASIHRSVANHSVRAIPVIATDNTRFSLPLGDGRAYIVYAHENLTVITDVISLLWKHYDRWLSLRGVE